ncbi:MAG: ATP-binding protein [Prevotella sp.]|nr:ATP-binding protein [Prevotella sp.]MDO4932978.1 ATP-binding protein [Prevotella sp.]
MERTAISELYEWKSRSDRKPLIVRGARQVGKTWLILDFARKAYGQYVYVNFEEESLLSHVFEVDFDIDRIITAISLRKQQDINKDTLLIFDEIQAAPRGVTALKYFCEKARGYHVIAAGSLLGIAMHQSDSFPVGKVDFVDLSPLDFHEFLLAMGEERIAGLLAKRDWQMVAMVKDRLTALLKTYYYVGGMPEVVDSYRRRKDFAEVRRIQNNILDTYNNDFSKHAPINEVPRIRMVWNSIAGQLAKENRKFIYGMLREGARAKDFEVAIEWLTDAGLIYKVNRTKSGELPLNAFEDFSAFKIYLLDVGLLSAINKLTAETLIRGNEIFNTYKGALTEQYFFQQIRGKVDFVYYWSAENSRGEVDFVVQKAERVIPIEVKAEENLRAKSLAAFVARNPGLHALRFSMSDYREQDWMTNIPLYAVTLD